MYPSRRYPNGRRGFPTVKDITSQLTLTICLKNNMDEEYRLALAAFALTNVDDANFHFRDADG